MRRLLLITLTPLLLWACEASIRVGPPVPTDPSDPTYYGGPNNYQQNFGAVCGDVGHVAARRVNRSEYNNIVRDLLDDVTKPGNAWPADPTAAFDNNGEVLSTTVSHVELLESAAGLLVDNALKLTPVVPGGGMPTKKTFEAETLADAMCPGDTEPPGADYTCFGYLTKTGGSPSFTYITMWENNYYLNLVENFPAAGEYNIGLRAFQAGAAVAKILVSLDGKTVYQADVKGSAAAPVNIAIKVAVTAGSHRLQIRNSNTARSYQRDLAIDAITVEGPLGAGPTPTPKLSTRARIMICDPVVDGDAPCAQKILKNFGRLAYRRPLTPAEVTDLSAFVTQAKAQGDSFDVGISNALKRIMMSPEFFYVAEADPNPDSKEPHPLTAHELATRLSLFLWASTPDDELLARADDGTLLDPSVLLEQARRMLADNKADALVDVFGAQWLSLRRLSIAQPAVDVFPLFDGVLREAMWKETSLYFRAYLREDLSLIDLIDAKFSFVNDRLAAHYGIPGITSSEHQRVDLSAVPTRMGVLTHGSILTSTSAPARTSPVRRGKWVLDQMLCREPVPPPANVPALPDQSSSAGKTLRQISEDHRNKPQCRGCHIDMDAIGFAMEAYDRIGSYRTKDGDLPITDLSGVMADGRRFNGAAELAQTIKADVKYSHCITKELFTYALTRDLTEQDECAVDEITKAAASKGFRFKDLALYIIQTPQFRQRRGGTR